MNGIIKGLIGIILIFLAVGIVLVNLIIIGITIALIGGLIFIDACIEAVKSYEEGS